MVSDVKMAREVLDPVVLQRLLDEVNGVRVATAVPNPMRRPLTDIPDYRGDEDIITQGPGGVLDPDALQKILPAEPDWSVHSFSPLQEALREFITEHGTEYRAEISEYLQKLKEITDQAPADGTLTAEQAQKIKDLTQEFTQQMEYGRVKAAVIGVEWPWQGINNAIDDVFNGSDFQVDTSKPGLEQMNDIAAEVLRVTEGDANNQYRDAAREYLIDMAEMQDKLDRAAGNPALEQALKEEMALRAQEFASDLDQPQIERQPNPDYDPSAYKMRMQQLIHMSPEMQRELYDKYMREHIEVDVTPPEMKGLAKDASDASHAIARDLGVDLPDAVIGQGVVMPVIISEPDNPFRPSWWNGTNLEGYSPLGLDQQRVIWESPLAPGAINVPALSDWNNGEISTQFTGEASQSATLLRIEPGTSLDRSVEPELATRTAFKLEI